MGFFFLLMTFPEASLYLLEEFLAFPVAAVMGVPSFLLAVLKGGEGGGPRI